MMWGRAGALLLGEVIRRQATCTDVTCVGIYGGGGITVKELCEFPTTRYP